MAHLDGRARDPGVYGEVVRVVVDLLPGDEAVEAVPGEGVLVSVS